MRGRSWWRGTAGSVAVATLLVLAPGAVLAQSPIPSPSVGADAPEDPASDLWSVARDLIPTVERRDPLSLERLARVPVEPFRVASR